MEELKSKIESLLFVSAKPMAISQLGVLLKQAEQKITAAGDELADDYKNTKRGIQIIKNGNKYQMVSSPENTEVVQEFFKDETSGELSRPSLETLTIIAYRGPISKAELNQIRGVNCALILRNLLLRGLIEASGKKSTTEEESDATDALYTVSFDFIRFLGINDVKDLPDYERLRSDQALDTALEKDQGVKEALNEKEENVVREEADQEERGEVKVELATKEVKEDSTKFKQNTLETASTDSR